MQEVDVYSIRLSSSPSTTTSSFVIMTKTEILFIMYDIFDLCYSFTLQYCRVVKLVTIDKFRGQSQHRNVVTMQNFSMRQMLLSAHEVNRCQVAL